jgi:integrase
VLDANPCRIRAAMQPKRRREIDILTPAQVDKLATKMPARLRASVLLAAWCGLRLGETSELRRKDVSDDCGLFRIRRAVTYRAGKFYVDEPKTAAGIRDVAVPPTSAPRSRRTWRITLGV